LPSGSSIGFLDLSSKQSSPALPSTSDLSDNETIETLRDEIIHKNDVIKQRDEKILSLQLQLSRFRAEQGQNPDDRKCIIM
jgi:hypothetical protein